MSTFEQVTEIAEVFSWPSENCYEHFREVLSFQATLSPAKLKQLTQTHD